MIANPRPDHYNGIVLDDEDRVIGFAPKGRADGTWHFVGVQVANASVFAPLARRRRRGDDRRNLSRARGGPAGRYSRRGE